MPGPVRYSPVRGEEIAEVPRQNQGSAMCCVMVIVNALAVVTIGLWGVAYWTTCMAMAPPNKWYNQDIGYMYQSDDKAYWCTHYNSWYHKNNLTRCVEALQHAEKAESHCWHQGGQIYALVAFAIFTGVVVANVGYCCGKKIIAAH